MKRDTNLLSKWLNQIYKAVIILILNNKLKFYRDA